MTTPPSTRQEVTQLLGDWSGGDERALEKLFPLVQPELHRLAHHYMSRERAGHTLQTTAILNEAYLRLAGQQNTGWQDRAHFFAVSAQLMRRILVDFARPSEDLSRYKLVFAPSLYLLSGGEADRLKLYVQNGGTLVSTFNTGLVDEHNMACDTGYPHDLTDLFGLEVLEFDQLPPGEENHLVFKGTFPTSHLHPAKLWCDTATAVECDDLAEGFPEPADLDGAALVGRLARVGVEGPVRQLVGLGEVHRHDQARASAGGPVEAVYVVERSTVAPLASAW